MISSSDRYQALIKKLKAGQRAIFKASPEEIALYLSELAQANQSKDETKLEQLFCLLSNTQQKDLRFEEEIQKILADFKHYSPDLIIKALSAARKHILEARFIQGDRLKGDFLILLEPLLYHSSPEVVEWTLRLVEEMGTQAIFFKKHFAKIMPGLLTFNKHKKNIKELIFMIDSRYKNFPSHG